MQTIEPSAIWNQPWLGPACAVGDFNDDGQNELFCLQTAGAHANSGMNTPPIWVPAIAPAWATSTGTGGRKR